MISNHLGKRDTEQTEWAAPAAARAQNSTTSRSRASSIISRFRKTMQRSTQKSNLTDDSGVMYSTSSVSLEAGNQPGHTHAAAGWAATQYSYTGGYGAAQDRLGRQPPSGHAPHGATTGYGAGPLSTPLFRARRCTVPARRQAYKAWWRRRTEQLGPCCRSRPRRPHHRNRRRTTPSRHGRHRGRFRGRQLRPFTAHTNPAQECGIPLLGDEHASSYFPGAGEYLL